MRILKFGGAALRDGGAIRRAAGIVRGHGGERPIVVVSALEGVTRLLGETAEAAAGGRYDWDAVRVRHRTALRQLELPGDLLDRHLAELRAILEHVRSEGALGRRRRDFVLSFGERMSARLVAAALRRGGVEATPVDAFDLGLLSEEREGLTLPVDGARERVREAALAVPGVAVVTGFVALDREGHLTTLGRNGSDLTAAWIGEAVGAERIDLWKEVPGVMTADPRLVPSVRVVPRLAYAEAVELAVHGAEVLHPAAARPAERSGIPIRVRDVRAPASHGTEVGPADEGRSGPVALAHRAPVALLTCPLELGEAAGAEAAALLAACRAAGLAPHDLALHGTEAVLSVPDADLPPALAGRARLERGLARIALVGRGAGEDEELRARLFAACRTAGADARPAPAGDGPDARVVLVPAAALASALAAAHRAFFEDAERRRAPGARHDVREPR